MSDKLGVTLQTVARWETSGQPAGPALLALGKVAHDHQHEDLVQQFQAAFEKWETVHARKAWRVHQEREGWTQVKIKTGEIQEAAQRLRAAVKPDAPKISLDELKELVATTGKEIYDCGNDIWLALEQITLASWKAKK